MTRHCHCPPILASGLEGAMVFFSDHSRRLMFMTMSVYGRDGGIETRVKPYQLDAQNSHPTSIVWSMAETSPRF